MACLVGAVVVAWLVTGCSVRQLLYPAPPIPVPSPPPGPIEELYLDTSNSGKVSVWFVAPEALDPSRPAALFFHGNGENLETMRMAGLYEDLMGLEIGFAAIDYPGYGRSSGRPSEGSLTEAGEVAWAWLERQFPSRPRVLCGWSLGAAVALRLAADHPDRVDAIVAMSAWTSLPDVATVHFPKWLVNLSLRERYASLALANRITAPSLVIHGARDRIIPAEQGRRLAEALEGSRWVEVPGAGHNDLLSRPEVWDELAAFFDTVAATSKR